jgi:transposase
MRRQAITAPGLAELEQAFLAHWTPEIFRRFQCVWLTEVLRLSAQDIAAALGLHIATVRRIRGAFSQDGVAAILGKGNRGGRRNQCLSREEEAVFLRSHPECFSRSGTPDLAALKAAFEGHVGRRIHKTTLYRLLERHGRRWSSPDPGRSGSEQVSSSARRKGSAERRKRGSRPR